MLADRLREANQTIDILRGENARLKQAADEEGTMMKQELDRLKKELEAFRRGIHAPAEASTAESMLRNKKEPLKVCTSGRRYHHR